MAAARQTLMYGTPTMSATMNAAAPMIGGIICPPVEATASTAPAKTGEYPRLFMRGIVNVPVPTTFATALPDIVPKKALDTTAILAGPPLNPPAKANEISLKNLSAPEV